MRLSPSVRGRPIGSCASPSSMRKVRRGARACGGLALAAILFPGSSAGQQRLVDEISGVARHGSDLLVVGDETPGAYFRVPIGRSRPIIPVIPRGRPVRQERISLALDLEGIDVLGDGRIALLSERLRALVTSEGLLVEYDDPVTEFASMGLEGLAVRALPEKASRIAVLWEGGYPARDDLPPDIRNVVGNRAFSPIVVVHELKAGQNNVEVEMGQATVIHLDTPKPPGREPKSQRFRATDLVWDECAVGDERLRGFIVLLSSRDSVPGKKPEYRYSYLQRFSSAGEAVDAPVDLMEAMPEELRGANWEGLGWFEKGRSVVLVHDHPPFQDPRAVVLDIPAGWRSDSAPKWTHVAKEDVVYYIAGPQQARQPDGRFSKDTRFVVLHDAGSYTQVQSLNGIVAYVSTSSLRRVDGRASKRNDRTELRELEKQYWYDYENGNATRLAMLVHDRMLGCDSTGKPVTRKSLVERVAEASFTGFEPSLERIETRVSNDVAVVLLNRQNRKRRVTHTWLRCEGKWMLLGGMSVRK